MIGRSWYVLLIVRSSMTLLKLSLLLSSVLSISAIEPAG